MKTVGELAAEATEPTMMLLRARVEAAIRNAIIAERERQAPAPSYVPQKLAAELLEMLEKALRPNIGEPNTLYGMVAEACRRVERLRAIEAERGGRR